MKNARGLLVVAAFNLLEAILLVAFTASFAMWLRAVTELRRLGGELPRESAGVYFLFSLLKDVLGQPAVFALAILLAATLAVSAMGIALHRNWARLLTLGTMPFRPFLFFELSWLLSGSSDYLIRILAVLLYAVIYARIVWYLFQPEVKRAFGGA